MLVYRKCECFVMLSEYVCVLCASCGSPQSCVLHDLQFVIAGRGGKRRPYGRGILQSQSHDCLVGSHECLLLVTPGLLVAVNGFIIRIGLCACPEMLWMSVLYVGFGSKVRPRTFGCISMGSAVLFIMRYYVGLKSSFQQVREECESKRAYVF